MPLDAEASRAAIEEHMATPLKLCVDEAAAGMYRVINNNMAQGVREITVKRGYDPREFPMVVAGGAGPLHACMIADELDIPMFVVPRESSIFCAAGMLMTDLQHDFVRSFVGELDKLDFCALGSVLAEMVGEGERLLAAEKIPEERSKFQVNLDCRYVKQYHEVSFPVALDAVGEGRLAEIARVFHAEHNRLYGYSLEDKSTPIELINIRLRAIGITEKPTREEQARSGEDPDAALKGERRVFVPEDNGFTVAPIYDGSRMRHGHRIVGPALVEQVHTTVFLSRSYDCICDKYGSFAVYQKGKESLVASTLGGTAA
jgi:N-methylhydantoinase A